MKINVCVNKGMIVKMILTFLILIQPVIRNLIITLNVLSLFLHMSVKTVVQYIQNVRVRTIVVKKAVTYGLLVKRMKMNVKLSPRKLVVRYIVRITLMIVFV